MLRTWIAASLAPHGSSGLDPTGRPHTVAIQAVLINSPGRQAGIAAFGKASALRPAR